MFALQNNRAASAELIEFSKSKIQEVINNVTGINFIMLCSTDGFELATIHKKDHYNNGKLAAVSSSILAMVSAFMQEIHLTGCQSITLDAENGKAILTSIPSKSHPMIIIALAEKNVLLGQLLYMLKHASNSIQKEST